MADGAAYLEAHKVPDAITAAVTNVLKTRPADPITAIGELLIKRQKSMVTVMVVGSGGREMAQSLKLAQSDIVDKVLVAPGNGGTEREFANLSLSLSDFETLAVTIRERNLELVVG